MAGICTTIMRAVAAVSVEKRRHKDAHGLVFVVDGAWAGVCKVQSAKCKVYTIGGLARPTTASCNGMNVNAYLPHQTHARACTCAWWM